MTEEGRRLTIERIDKYKKEVEDKKTNIVAQSVSLALLGLLAISGTFGSLNASDDLAKALFALIPIVSSIGGVDRLKDLLIAISRKTGIEIKIEDLEAQLKEDEFEREEKGKSI